MADNLCMLFFSGNMKITIWNLSPISSNNSEGLYLKFILSLLRSWSFDSFTSRLNDEVYIEVLGSHFYSFVVTIQMKPLEQYCHNVLFDV